MSRYLEIQPGIFGADEISLMSAALNKAWAIVEASGATYVGENAELARAALANSIIAAARNGERDARRLSEGALADLAAGFPCSNSPAQRQ